MPGRYRVGAISDRGQPWPQRPQPRQHRRPGLRLFASAMLAADPVLSVRWRGGGPVRQEPSKEFRGPVELMLELAVPGYRGSGRRHHEMPFSGSVPGFSGYLSSERGLRPASVRRYQHHLDRFEAYLARIGVRRLGELSPAILSAFIAERSAAGLAKTTVQGTCGALRVFLRYAHRRAAPRVPLPPGDLRGGRCGLIRRPTSPATCSRAGMATALRRNALRTCRASRIASRPFPRTSPMITRIPGPVGMISYRSPPTDASRVAERYRAAMVIPVISGGSGGSSANCEACAIAVIRASRSSRRQRIPATTTAIALITQTAATWAQ